MTTQGNDLVVDGKVRAHQATQAGECVVLGDDMKVPGTMVKLGAGLTLDENGALTIIPPVPQTYVDPGSRTWIDNIGTVYMDGTTWLGGTDTPSRMVVRYARTDEVTHTRLFHTFETAEVQATMQGKRIQEFTPAVVRGNGHGSGFCTVEIFDSRGILAQMFTKEVEESNEIS